MPKLILVLLLGLTLSIKLALGHSLGVQAAAAADPELSTARVEAEAFLADHGLVIERWHGQEEIKFVSAERDSCRVFLAALSPLSWHRDLLHRLVPPGGHAFFVFAGSIHGDQPRWQSWITYFWRMTGRAVGMNVRYEPLFGVVALDACRDLAIPWAEVGARR